MHDKVKDLVEARKINDSYLIMEGDDGGQIYLVCPVELVKCSQSELEKLLSDLDELSWKDISMAALYFQQHRPGDVVAGGMGGGYAEVGLWVHPKLDSSKSKIIHVLNGSSEG